MIFRSYLKFWLNFPSFKKKILTSHQKSIYSIPYHTLAKAGVKLLIFDVDDTLCGYHDLISNETLRLLKDLRKKFHIGILSNCNTARRNEVKGMMEGIDVYITAENCKPAAHCFQSILHHFNIAGKNTAMIGDRAVMDLWGALQAEISHRILIEPYSEFYKGRKSPYLSRLVRTIEKKCID